MKKTRKERVIGLILDVIKHHRGLKYPMLFLMVVYLCFEYVLLFVCKNPKRITGLAIVPVFFFVGSSFAFNSQSEDMTKESLTEQITYNVTYAQDEINSYYEEDYEIDDNEVLMEYSDMEFDRDITTERYSAEDILKENSAKNISTEQSEDNKTHNSLSSDDWSLLLINKQHPVPVDYEFTLGTLMGSVQCDERIFDDLLSMLQEAKEDNVDLFICSSYRDVNRQEVLFQRKINKYMSTGMSYTDAYKKTSKTVTVPGASEHQVGLALDIVTGYHTSLNEAFGETKAGIWLRENSYKYGFILRYPKGKEDITGISYEPWHFRYVGKDAAQIIYDEDITLEELIEQISRDDNGLTKKSTNHMEDNNVSNNS